MHTGWLFPTFLSTNTNARPKIADYPFTTLHPGLGVVKVGDGSDAREFVMADIPGLIEGAHEGAGLGTRFLGHVERCRALLHLVDGTQDDVAGAYRTVRTELKAYGGNLARKKEIVALNKCDAIAPGELAKKRAALEKASGKSAILLSGVAGQGVPDVLRALARIITQKRMERAERLEAARPRIRMVPRTRAERQAVNFKSPIVPKESIIPAQRQKAKAKTTVTAKKTVKKKTAKKTVKKPVKKSPVKKKAVAKKTGAKKTGAKKVTPKKKSRR